MLIPFFLFSLCYMLLLTVLGKATLWEGLIATVTLHGSGMQLYFLPYLFFITVFYAIAIDNSSLKIRTPINIIALNMLLLFCMLYPTSSSTGSEYKLLPFYFASYIFGLIYRATLDQRYQSLGVLALIILLILVGMIDPRFFDLAGIIALFKFVHHIDRFLPDRRLPGSGGIYLLHTPIINYTISILLMRLGVVQGVNILMSVFITYIVCLFITLVFIRFLPKYRWLLLE